MPKVGLEECGASSKHAREYDRVRIVGDWVMASPPNSRVNPGVSLEHRDGEAGEWDVIPRSRVCSISGVEEDDLEPKSDEALTAAAHEAMLGGNEERALELLKRVVRDDDV